MIRIDRKEYLDFLVKSKDRQIIKVVSGVRRCGKSTLFEIFAKTDDDDLLILSD